MAFLLVIVQFRLVVIKMNLCMKVDSGNLFDLLLLTSSLQDGFEVFYIWWYTTFFKSLVEFLWRENVPKFSKSEITLDCKAVLQIKIRLKVFVWVGGETDDYLVSL